MFDSWFEFKNCVVVVPESQMSLKKFLTMKYKFKGQLIILYKQRLLSVCCKFDFSFNSYSAGIFQYKAYPKLLQIY